MEELRRAHCLVCYWAAGEFRVENYLIRGCVVLPPLLLHLLPDEQRYVKRRALVARLERAGFAEPYLVDRLVERGVLVERNGRADRHDHEVHSRWRWGHDARWFHFSSRDVRYEVEAARQEQLLRDLAAQEPPPPPQREPAAVPLRLPGEFADQPGGLWDALLNRRTRRVFDGRPLTLETFGTLLRWTWGATAERTHPVLGPYFLKTSPSGGARHPVDVYPLVLRVDGLASGAYRYAPREHGLEPLDVEISEDLLVDLFAGHEWFREAPVAFVMTAVLDRNAWKYRHSHAYRVLLLDAGHLGQTFHLVCTTLGLAPFTSGATDDRLIESVLGLDEAEEVVVYAAATGYPGGTADGRVHEEPALVE